MSWPPAPKSTKSARPLSRPRARPGSAHHHPQERGGGELQRDGEQLIGEVAAYPEDVVHDAEYDERQRDEVTAVLAQEIVDVEATTGEKVPVVPKEPDLAGGDDIEDESDDFDDDERGPWRCARDRWTKARRRE